MGIFSALFGGRKRREQELLKEYARAAAEGHNLAKLRSAGSTLNEPPDRGSEDLRFVAELSSKLIRQVSGDPHRSDDNLLTAGLFAMVAANHFSYLTAEPFEEASTLAVMMVLGPQRIDSIGAVVDTYNSTTAQSPDLIKAIGLTIAKWADDPSPETLARLRTLYAACVRSLG